VGDAVIIDGVRTPVGRYGGALASVRPDDLAALTLRALVDRVGLDPGELEDVYLGCANQAGEDNRNVARMAVLLAGFPVEVGGMHCQPALR
jgi:acetyl-CoA acetyltransferase